MVTLSFNRAPRKSQPRNSAKVVHNERLVAQPWLLPQQLLSTPASHARIVPERDALLLTALRSTRGAEMPECRSQAGLSMLPSRGSELWSRWER